MTKPYYQDKFCTIYHGDCLEIMPELESVDMIAADLPYGITACKWDTVIPFDPLWQQYKRLIKDNGAIVLTASQPFTSMLIMSNLKMFRYCWVWEKDKPSNFALADKQPMKYHEDVVIFYSNQSTYNKQMWSNGIPVNKSAEYGRTGSDITNGNLVNGKQVGGNIWKNPKSIIKFNVVNNMTIEKVPHSTQKPVALFSYLIRTYTNEGDTVLDNVMGSGTTLVAAKQLNRKAIGIEIEEKYCEIAVRRLSQEVLEFNNEQITR